MDVHYPVTGATWGLRGGAFICALNFFSCKCGPLNVLKPLI